MRGSIFLAVLLVFGSAIRDVAADSGAVDCPAPGTQFTFSDGARIEAIDDQGSYVCRFKSLKTLKTFDRLLGVFNTTGPDADRLRSLLPLQVGRRVSFSTSGASVVGSDGFWFQTVSVERAENVVTPAGTFPAFVILSENQSVQGSHGLWQYRYWYAPEIGHVVKFEFLTVHGNPPPNYPKRWELTAYAPVPSAGSKSTPTTAMAFDPDPTLGRQSIVTAVPAPVPTPKPEPAKAAAVPVPIPEPIKVAAAAPAPVSPDGPWRCDSRPPTARRLAASAPHGRAFPSLSSTAPPKDRRATCT